MDRERQAKLTASHAAARRKSGTKDEERAAQRAQAVAALKHQLEQVARLEQDVTADDRRFGIPKLVSPGNRVRFNDTLHLLANAGEDTSGLYMPPGRPPAAPNGEQFSSDLIQAIIVRRHIERALQRFAPGFLTSRKSTSGAA